MPLCDSFCQPAQPRQTGLGPFESCRNLPMRPFLPIVALAFLAQILHPLVASASDDRPRGTIMWIEDDSPRLEEQSHSSNIIYLNRCAGGCTIHPGGNDSRSNHSRIASRQSTVSEWRHSDEAWDDLVQCVQAMYDPYDIVVTDENPGDTPHFESITAGTPGELDLARGVGGIAPFSCGVVNNAITFTFANRYSSVREICEVVAQETAHAFGLEHAYDCEDPMTYLPDCGTKWFQDRNSQCGEFSPRACDCRTNQNSHRLLMDHFGPGPTAGPNMKFARPTPNSNIEGDFKIEVRSDDYYFDVSEVEVFVNGESLGTSSIAPFIFSPPEGLEGLTTLEVRAVDRRGFESSKSVEVNVGAPCSAGSCPASDRVCYQGFCIKGPEVEGGFGFACEKNADCSSELCATDSEGMGVCTETCELENGDCPAGYGCVSTGETNVCWPGVKEGGEEGGCALAGERAGGLATLALLLLGLAMPRRRRRR